MRQPSLDGFSNRQEKSDPFHSKSSTSTPDSVNTVNGQKPGEMAAVIEPLNGRQSLSRVSDPFPQAIDMRLAWVCGAGIVALSCVIALTGYSPHDESWFLRVLERVNAGETLYRDVYYPLLPLAVYVGAAATFIFGPNFLVLQALFAACFVATAWICDSLARQLEISRVGRALLLLGVCVWSSPAAINHVWSLYQPMATLFLLLCLRMVLAWSRQTVEKRKRIELAVAAIAAGAGFATKDQVGALTLVALLISVTAVAVHRKFSVSQLLRTVAGVVTVFIGTVLLILVPVMVWGGLEQLAEYFVVEREAFVRTSSISYFDGIDHFFRSMIRFAFIRDPFEVLHFSFFLLAPLAIVSLIVVLFRHRGEDRIRSAVLLAFSTGAWLAIFPRSDIWHVLFVSAMTVVGLLYAADRLFRSPMPRNMIFGLAFVCLSVGFAEAVYASAVRVIVLKFDFLRLPHFQYAMMSHSNIDELRQNRVKLQAVATTGPLFLLTHEAAFYYLITNIKNPTPIDYPVAGSMGRDGEGKMIRAIQSHENSLVCLRSYPEPALRPERLENFVRTQMLLVGRLGVCDLYQSMK